MTTTTTPATGIMWHTDSLWQSEKQDKMIPALLKFHRSELRISKDRTVPVGGNRTRSYTTLDEILSKVKPVLTDCGLVLHQYLAGGEVVTMLTHESGQFIASKVAFVPMTGNNTNNLQNAGGGLTYLKRYCISALLCINAEDDDDGASSTGSVLIPLPDSKVAEMKKWIANGGDINQVTSKYKLTPAQMKEVTNE
jgi:hypothetical protein